MPHVPSRRRVAASLVGAATAALLLPAAASAHGLVGRQDLPIPRWLFAWAAAVVLVVSFVALATLWPKPRLEHAPEGERLLTVPGWLPRLASVAGVGLLGLSVYAGYAGTTTPTANFAPTFTGVLFWVGVPFFSIFLGDWFAPFNPWRATGRAVGWLVSRVAGDDTPEPLPYPTWLGRWPAAVGIVAFAWFELVYAGFNVPSDVATAILVYSAIQLLGMSLFGVAAWCENAEAFGVYFALIGRLGPLGWRGRELHARPLLAGATGLTVVPGTVALLVALIGTTSFDGFSQGPTWNAIAPGLQGRFLDLGLTDEWALRAAFTVGLIGVLLVIGALYRLGAHGMRSVDGTRGTSALSRRFVHSLVPIAMAYVVAHYFSYLFVQGQAIGYLASDPLGNGANLFGTGSATIDYALLSPNVIWIAQVIALVCGHVGGLVLAHDRALVTWTDPRKATRSQYWMLAVMVTYTSLGLWLLSASS